METVRPKKSGKLTLPDRLSRLTYISACQLLGPSGKELIGAGAAYDTIDIQRDVYLGKDLFRLRLHLPEGDDAVVTITLMASARKRLHFNCTRCQTSCEHIGAALSLILEEKSSLDLAEPPLEDIPLEHLSEAQLVERALAERSARARQEKFRLTSSDPSQPWVDYVISSAASGRSYRVALRGRERGSSYCSCPDFRTNTLGTCKHILYALERIGAKFSRRVLQKLPKRTNFAVHVRYGEQLDVHLEVPDKLSPAAQRIARPFLDRPIADVPALLRAITRLERIGTPVIIYPDAEELMQQRLFQLHIAALARQIREDPAQHPLRTTLLRVELLPYQLDGIAFAAGAGRAILADDMGLGKTIQGIGLAELLAREAAIQRVLIVCPASLKSQWRNEIQRFCDREVQLVAGSAKQRALDYQNSSFFTICNYEQVLRDILAVERTSWDLIILDEAQRIKNWESKTSRVIKGLKSRFALVLSGTPLENRLDELYSVVQFIDDRRLPPAFRFFNKHRVVDEDGKVIGYKNLDQLRKNLRPILLRRTRNEVLGQLPPRTTEIVRIAPTTEQLEIHAAHMRKVSAISRKSFITEMDLLQLQKALLMCRMVADSTFLIDKQEPAYSSKLEHLSTLLEQVAEEPWRKVVLFSEWTTMLSLIERLLQKQRLKYVRLDGSVPQKKRQELVHRFQQDAACRLFLTTNAGSTGLNLQAANTVINVDLPWNPAVLEQRISRAHRMGQQQPVQVFVLVTEETIEENLLKTLAQKHDLALAALDAESEVSEVEFTSGMEALKRRLEVLLGAPAEAPVHVRSRTQAHEQLDQFSAQRERVAAAAGEMLGAVFGFLGQLVDQQPSAGPPAEMVATVRNRLRDCVDVDESGRQRLSITLPDAKALDNLADTLARLLVSSEKTTHQ